MLRWHLGESSCYDGGVDQAGVEQRCHEVPVLLAEGAQLRNAQVFFVEALARVLRVSGERGGVRVLDSD